MDDVRDFPTAVSRMCLGNSTEPVFQRDRDVPDAKTTAAPSTSLAGAGASCNGSDEGVSFSILSEQRQRVQSRLKQYGKCLSPFVNIPHMKAGRADREEETQQTQAGSMSKKLTSFQRLVQSVFPGSIGNSAQLPTGQKHSTAAPASPESEDETLLRDVATVAVLPAAASTVGVNCGGLDQRTHLEDISGSSDISGTWKACKKGGHHSRRNCLFPQCSESTFSQHPLSRIERGSCRAVSGESYALEEHIHGVGLTAFFYQTLTPLVGCVAAAAALCARLTEPRGNAKQGAPVPQGVRPTAVNAFVQRVALLIVFCCVLRSDSLLPAGRPGSRDPSNERSVALFFAQAQPTGNYSAVNLENNWGPTYGQRHQDYRQYTSENRVSVPDALNHFPVHATRGDGQQGEAVEGLPSTHFTEQGHKARRPDSAQQYTEQLLSSIKQHYISQLEHRSDALPAPAEHLRPSPEQLQLEFATRLHLAQQDQQTQPAFRPYVENGTTQQDSADSYFPNIVDRPDLQQYAQLHTAPAQHQTKQQIHVPVSQRYNGTGQQGYTSEHHNRHSLLQQPAQGHLLQQYRTEPQHIGAPPVQQYSSKPFVTQDSAPPSNSALFPVYSDRVRPTVNQATEEVSRLHLQPYGDTEQTGVPAREPYILPVEHVPVGVRVSSQPPEHRHWHNIVTSGHLQESGLSGKPGQLNVPAEALHSQRLATSQPQPAVNLLHSHHHSNLGVAEPPQPQDFPQHHNGARNQDYSRRREHGDWPVQQGAPHGYSTAQIIYGGAQSYGTPVRPQTGEYSGGEVSYQQQRYADTVNTFNQLPTLGSSNSLQYPYYPQQPESFRVQEDPRYAHASVEQLYTQTANHRKLQHPNNQWQQGNTTYSALAQPGNAGYSATAQQGNTSYPAPTPQENTSYPGGKQQGSTGGSAPTHQGDTSSSIPTQQQSTSNSAPAQQEDSRYATSAQQGVATYSTRPEQANAGYPAFAQRGESQYSAQAQQRDGIHSVPVQQENRTYSAPTQQGNTRYGISTQQEHANHFALTEQGNASNSTATQYGNTHYPATAQQGIGDYPGVTQQWKPPQEFLTNTSSQGHPSWERHGTPAFEERQTISAGAGQEPKQPHEYQVSAFPREEAKRPFEVPEQTSEPQHGGYVRRRLVQVPHENRAANTPSASLDSDQQQHPQAQVPGNADGLPLNSAQQFESDQSSTSVRQHAAEHQTVNWQAGTSQADRTTEHLEAPITVVSTATRRHLEVSPGNTQQGVTLQTNVFEQEKGHQHYQSEHVQREVLQEDALPLPNLYGLWPEASEDQQQENSAQQQDSVLLAPVDTDEEEDNAGAEAHGREHANPSSSASATEKRLTKQAQAPARRLSGVEPSKGFDYYAALNQQEQERYLLPGKPLGKQKDTTDQHRRVGIERLRLKREDEKQSTSDEASSESDDATSEEDIQSDEDDESGTEEAEEDREETDGNPSRLDREDEGLEVAVGRRGDGETYSEGGSGAGLIEKPQGRRNRLGKKLGELRGTAKGDEADSEVDSSESDVESEDGELEDDAFTESDTDTDDDRDEQSTEAVATDQETGIGVDGLKTGNGEHEQVVVEEDDEHHEEQVEPYVTRSVEKAAEEKNTDPAAENFGTTVTALDSVREKEESEAVAVADEKTTQEPGAESAVEKDVAAVAVLDSFEEKKDEREAVAAASVSGSEKKTTQEPGAESAVEKDVAAVADLDSFEEKKDEREAVAVASVSGSKEKTLQEPGAESAVEKDVAAVADLDSSEGKKEGYGVIEEGAFEGERYEAEQRLAELTVAEDTTLNTDSRRAKDRAEESVDGEAEIPDFRSQEKATGAEGTAAKELDSLIEKEDHKEVVIEATVPRAATKEAEEEGAETAETGVHGLKEKKEEHTEALVEASSGTDNKAAEKEGAGVPVEKHATSKADSEGLEEKKLENNEAVAETPASRFVESPVQQHGAETTTETELNGVKDHKEAIVEAGVPGADWREAEEQVVEITVAQQESPTTDLESVKEKTKEKKEATVEEAAINPDGKADEKQGLGITDKDQSGADNLNEKEEEHKVAAAQVSVFRSNEKGAAGQESGTVTGSKQTTVKSLGDAEERLRETDGEAPIPEAKVKRESTAEANGSKDNHNGEKGKDIKRKEHQESGDKNNGELSQVEIGVQEGAPPEIPVETTDKSQTGGLLESGNLPEPEKDVNKSSESDRVKVDGHPLSGRTEELQRKIGLPDEDHVSTSETENGNADVILTNTSVKQPGTEADSQIQSATANNEQHKKAEQTHDQVLAIHLSPGKETPTAEGTANPEDLKEPEEHSAGETAQKKNGDAAEIQSQGQEQGQEDAAESEAKSEIHPISLPTRIIPGTSASQELIGSSEGDANVGEENAWDSEQLQGQKFEEGESLRKDAPPEGERQIEGHSGEKRNDSGKESLGKTAYDRAEGEELVFPEENDRGVEDVPGIVDKPKKAESHDLEEKLEREKEVEEPTQAVKPAPSQGAKAVQVQDTAETDVDEGVEEGKVSAAGEEIQEEKIKEEEVLQASGTPLQPAVGAHNSREEPQPHIVEKPQKKEESVTPEQGFEIEEDREASTDQAERQPRSEEAKDVEKGVEEVKVVAEHPEDASAGKGKQAGQDARVEEQVATSSAERNAHEDKGEERVIQQAQVTSVKSEREEHIGGAEGQQAKEGNGGEEHHIGTQGLAQGDEAETGHLLLKTKERAEGEKQIEKTGKGGGIDAEGLQNTLLQGDQGDLNRARAYSQHEKKVAYNPLPALEEGMPIGLWRGPNGEVTENPPFDSLPSHTAGETTSPGRARRQSPFSWAVKEKGVAADKQGDRGVRDAGAKAITEETDFDEKDNSVSTALPRAFPEVKREGHAVGGLLPQVPGLLFPAGPSAHPGKPGLKDAAALATKGQRQGRAKFMSPEHDTTFPEGKGKSELKEEKAQFSPTLSIFREKVDHEDTLFGSENGAVDPIAYSTLPPGAAAKRLKKHRKRDWKLKAAAKAAKKEALKRTAGLRTGEEVPNNDLPGAVAFSAASEKKQAQGAEKSAAGGEGEEAKVVTAGKRRRKDYKPGLLAHQAVKAAAAGGRDGSGVEAYLLLPRQSERIAAADVTTASGIHIDDTKHTGDQPLTADDRVYEHPGTTRYIRQRRVGPTVGPGPAAFLPRFLYRPHEVEPTSLTTASELDGSSVLDISTDLTPHVDMDQFEVVPTDSVSEPEALPTAEKPHTHADKPVEQPANHTIEHEEPVSPRAALTNSRLASTLAQETVAAEQTPPAPQQAEPAIGKGECRQQNEEGIERGEDKYTGEEFIWEDTDEESCVQSAESGNRSKTEPRGATEVQAVNTIKKSAAVSTTSFSIAVLCGPLFSVGWLLFSSL